MPAKTSGFIGESRIVHPYPVDRGSISRRTTGNASRCCGQSPCSLSSARVRRSRDNVSAAAPVQVPAHGMSSPHRRLSDPHVVSRMRGVGAVHAADPPKRLVRGRRTCLDRWPRVLHHTRTCCLNARLRIPSRGPHRRLRYKRVNNSSSSRAASANGAPTESTASGIHKTTRSNAPASSRKPRTGRGASTTAARRVMRKCGALPLSSLSRRRPVRLPSHGATALSCSSPARCAT